MEGRIRPRKNLADRVETNSVRLAPTLIGMTAFLPTVAVPSGASAPLLPGETRSRGWPSQPSLTGRRATTMPGMASPPHRYHQLCKSNKIENPPEIVCECGQAEFAPHLLQSAHQKCALVHPLLDRAKWMFHRLAPLIENLGPLCQPFLHPVQYGLIF